jgi:uncharacterized membrane protein YgcG
MADERLYELVRNKQDLATFAHFFASEGDTVSPQGLVDAAALLINYKSGWPVGVQTDILHQFFARGLDPNAKTSRDIPLLVVAILKSNLTLMKELIRAGADINREVDSRWPIMEALGMGRLEIINELLVHGADIRTPRVQGRTFTDFLERGEYPQWGEFAAPLLSYQQEGRAALLKSLRGLAQARLARGKANVQQELRARAALRVGERRAPENVIRYGVLPLLNIQRPGQGMSVQTATRLLAAVNRPSSGRRTTSSRRSSSSGSRSGGKAGGGTDRRHTRSRA